MMFKKMTSNFFHKIMSTFVSTLFGLVWIALIYLPQEKVKIFVVWTSIYFFPFIFIATYIISQNVTGNIKSFFLNSKIMTFITVILVILLIISHRVYIINVTLFSFFTNLFSGLFAIFMFHKVYKKSD